MPEYTPLVLHNRELTLSKAVIAPELGARSVLTNEPWDFVDLDLVRRKQVVARFYWQQAREFYSVAAGLRLQSAPLLLYYAFMNAAKALLSSKGVLFDECHGVKKWVPSSSTLKDLTIGVKFMRRGVLRALSSYYQENESSDKHSLADIFFNLPYIHRTYCLTKEPSAEMFIPIVRPRLVYEDGTTNVFLMAELSSNFPNARYCSTMPASLVVLSDQSPQGLLSAQSVSISSVALPTVQDLTSICSFLKTLREDLFYINGLDTLWYVKAVPTKGNRLQRQATTLTLAAMHRLSEECRYDPMTMADCLEGENNWLVSEFIKMSGVQFIDEMASEITGKQFLKPNVRPAK